MSYLVRNPEDRFSRDEAQLREKPVLQLLIVIDIGYDCFFRTAWKHLVTGPPDHIEGTPCEPGMIPNS